MEPTPESLAMLNRIRVRDWSELTDDEKLVAKVLAISGCGQDLSADVSKGVLEDICQGRGLWTHTA